MHSRAHLLIARDYENLLAAKPWGIEAQPLKEDNLFEWTATIQGPQNTCWQGGLFRLYIKFTEHYNTRPPDVCFHTIPFHPNVDAITGKPALDMLINPDEWKDSYTLSHILVAIQKMLVDPVLDQTVNSEALDLLLYSPHSYNQMVQTCVSASQRVQAGLSPYGDGSGASNKTKKTTIVNEVEKVRYTPKTAPLRAGKVSFEDYHSSWMDMATSKTDMESAHKGVYSRTRDNQQEKCLSDEKRDELLYGRFTTKDTKSTEDDQRQARLDQVNKMRKLYMQPRSAKKQSSYQELDQHVLKSKVRLPEEPWEEEVDELVKWTHNLDDEML